MAILCMDASNKNGFKYPDIKIIREHYLRVNPCGQ
jgi:hypothetical protein